MSVGSTELTNSGGAGFAGAGAEMRAEAPGSPTPERSDERRLDGAHSRRRLAGAGPGAQAPAWPAPERKCVRGCRLRRRRSGTMSNGLTKHLIRRGGRQDIPFLRDMLRHAYHWHVSTLDDSEVPIERYVDNFGRPGDAAVVALEAGHPIGAAWYRVFPPNAPGWG